MQIIDIGESTFGLDLLTAATHSRDALDAEAGAIFALFLEREREFAFNPSIVNVHPDIDDPSASAFLTNPVRYIGGRIAVLEAAGEPIVRVVVPTTYGDRLKKPLSKAGYAVTKIDMPAGPDHTYAFALVLPGKPGPCRTLHLEAVNEKDEKIRPTFVLRLTDAQDRLYGGACGAIGASDGGAYAYLSTLTLRAGLPRTAGTRLANATLDHLRSQGVKTVNLGT
ncbi:MAG: hypothetical protein KDG89_00535 [Geminicoccaceae bacterium]|nr:hypothetical protein [Geminicoccaceae bacterium]